MKMARKMKQGSFTASLLPAKQKLKQGTGHARQRLRRSEWRSGWRSEWRLSWCPSWSPVWLGAFCLLFLGATASRAQQEPALPPSAVSPRSSDPATTVVGQASNELRKGLLVRITLPITGQVDALVQSQIERQLQLLPAASATSDRPVLILEFDTLRGASGRGSQFERCLSLARFLSGPALDRVQTVAYFPGAGQEGQPVQALTGHALLVALACESWAMDDAASISSLGFADDSPDPFVVEAYRSIASRRQTLPVPFVEALVDSTRGLARVEMTDGTDRWVSVSELSDLEASGEVARSESLLQPGEIGSFDASGLFRRQLLELMVSGRAALAERLRVSPEILEGDPAAGGAWKPVRVKLEGRIDARRADWLLTALDQRLQAGADLVIVEIDSPGGDFGQSVRLAQRLLDLDPVTVRTVALVGEEARGGAALVALACDHLLMKPSGVLGGPGTPEVTPADMEVLGDMVGRWENRGGLAPDWIRALLDPNLKIQRVRHRQTGQEKAMSEASRGALSPDEQGVWESIGEVATEAGLTAAEAQRYGLARHLVTGYDELAARYRIAPDLEQLQPTAAFRSIDRFARFIAQPWISWWLLLLGMMFLSSEMSSPGVGFPGFAAAICFSLYFWAQFLGGNAHWLEVLLFVLGFSFLLFEIFVLPGFGMFGFAGVVMVLVSIVLASQTFIIPLTSEDYQRLPYSLSTVLALVLGLAIPMYVIPNYIDRIPILRRMALNPARDVAFTDMAEREQMVQYEHLKGKMGVAVTDLKPGGKIQVGDDVLSVISGGMTIDRNTKVVIQEVRGNRIVVKPWDGGRVS